MVHQKAIGKIMAKSKRKSFFKFKTFSKKQRMVLNWWTDSSPVKEKDGIIADGAIRSGKTICMSLSYVIWAMERFENQNFGMCGKTIGSFRRNVLFWLKLMLKSRGYKVADHRSDNLVIVSRNGVENYFYIFGGKDERSQDLIQGITLAGCFFDEVALMPESFVNQATGRCSVDGSKFWFNCNPDNKKHWFKVNWIDNRDKKNLIYLHFTMDDNLSLSEKTKKRYRSMYVGVFFKRFILGIWCNAEGLLFPQYADNTENWEVDELPLFEVVNIGLDIGGTRSHSTLIGTGITIGYKKIVSFLERKITHKKGSIDTDTLCEETVVMIKLLMDMGYIVENVFVDNAEQVILNSIRRAVYDAGVPTNVLDCRKVDGKTRILVYNLLLNQHRMQFKDVPIVTESLSTALFDSKKNEDAILDDFTTDIDTFDAHFYSWSYYMDYITAS